MLKVFFLIFFIIPSTVFSLETNANATITVDTDIAEFMQPFRITYIYDNIDKIIDVTPSSYDFAQTSIDIETETVISNGFVIKITPYEISNFTVPSMEITALYNDKTNRFLTPSVPINAEILDISQLELAPIEDIFEFRDLRWLWITLTSLLIIAAIIAGIYFLNKRKKAAADNALYTSTDPYEEILTRLTELSKTEIDPANSKEFFILLSEIIRRFLERVMNFPAPEMSTTEIKTYFNKVNIDNDIFEITMYILRLCDRVKYAKHIPSTGQIKKSLDESFALVEKIRAIYQKPDKENGDEV
jgi:hypothetical protein